MSAIIKIATVAGPALLKVLKKYGPQMKQIAHDHPELLGTIKQRLSGAVALKTGGNSLKTMASHINTLKDQVTYLYATANTPAVARQASAWRSELDALENMLPVLGTMSRSAQKTQVRAVQKKIDELSTSILAATINDDIEDAQTFPNDSGQG